MEFFLLYGDREIPYTCREIKGKEAIEIGGHQLFDEMAQSKSKTFLEEEEEEFKITLEVTTVGVDKSSLPSAKVVEHCGEVEVLTV